MCDWSSTLWLFLKQRALFIWSAFPFAIPWHNYTCKKLRVFITSSKLKCSWSVMKSSCRPKLCFSFHLQPGTLWRQESPISFHLCLTNCAEILPTSWVEQGNSQSCCLHSPLQIFFDCFLAHGQALLYSLLSAQCLHRALRALQYGCVHTRPH